MIVTFLYYALSAYIGFIIIWHLLKSKKCQDELLYIISLIPFLLRLLRLK